MPGVEDILGLAVVAVLARYLFIKHRQRMPGPFAPRNPASWTGKAIDVTRLKPTIDGVHHDYLAARPSRMGFCYHKALLGFVRRAVAQKAYFRDRKSGAQTQVQ